MPLAVVSTLTLADNKTGQRQTRVGTTPLDSSTSAGLVTISTARMHPYGVFLVLLSALLREGGAYFITVGLGGDRRKVR